MCLTASRQESEKMLYVEHLRRNEAIFKKSIEMLEVLLRGKCVTDIVLTSEVEMVMTQTFEAFNKNVYLSNINCQRLQQIELWAYGSSDISTLQRNKIHQYAWFQEMFKLQKRFEKIPLFYIQRQVDKAGRILRNEVFV